MFTARFNINSCCDAADKGVILIKIVSPDPRIGDLQPKDIRVLIEFLRDQNYPELQYYALFALTNVDAFGEKLISYEALPLLMCLMKSKHIHIQIQVMITISRIAFDFPKTCYYIEKGLKVLPNLVSSHRHAYCYERARILNIASFLMHYGHGYGDVQSQTLAGLSFLSAKVRLEFSRKAYLLYIDLISYADPFIVVHALRIIADTLAFTAPHCTYQDLFLLQGDLLRRLYSLSLSHHKYKIVRFQVCQILALIVANFPKVMDYAGGFEIIGREEMPSSFTVIKDLCTGQEIDFSDNFTEAFEGGSALLRFPAVRPLSVGPFT